MRHLCSHVTDAAQPLRRASRLMAGLAGMCLTLTFVGACSSSAPESSDTTTAVAPATTAPRPAQKVAVPKVTGPITGPGNPWSAVTSPGKGYDTAEYFLSGTATSYKAVGDLDVKGNWTAEPDAKADYETRVLVHRPADAKKFNGTVVVEWLNVSAGFESAPDFLFTQRELERSGYAWVGVSAQEAGVDSGGGKGGVLGIKPLKQMEPERYAALHHPGDDFSYDIYSQVAAVVRQSGASNPLGGLKVDHVIADGESQSAFRMVTYFNAVQPLTHAFDGFIVHSRWADATALNRTSNPPTGAHIRTDLPQPIMIIESETDVPRFAPARQPDAARLRTWEITGTSHVDQKALGGALGCSTPVNDGPQVYVMDAALAGLNNWMAHPDSAPPHSPRIELDAKGAVKRAADGNALGGLRTPQLDVPLATLSGDGGGSSGFCVIAGSTKPFPASEVTSRYGSKAKYLAAFDAAAKGPIAKGFLLAADLPEMHAEAAKNYPSD